MTYFDSRESAYRVYGEDDCGVVTLLANKYIADNPKVPYRYRRDFYSGIKCDREGWYQFHFGERFPESPVGKVCIAIGQLFCHTKKSSDFQISCMGPTSLKVNETEVFKSAAHEEGDDKTVTFHISLEKGYNRFVFVTEKTVIGFGFNFRNAMPQWEPTHFISPVEDNAGFIYSSPCDGKDDDTILWYPPISEEDCCMRPFAEAQNFGKWNYQCGVTLYGLLAAADYLKRSDWFAYVQKHVGMAAGIYEYALEDKAVFGYPGVDTQLCWLSELDDCGSFGSLMLEVNQYADTDMEGVKRIADDIADFMKNKQRREPDGAFSRHDGSMWIDDLYMSVPFLCRYSIFSGDRLTLDEACKQVLLFKRYFFMPNLGLMSHIYGTNHQKANQIPWGRGNGWVIFSLSELLKILPKSHSAYGEMVKFFNEMLTGILNFQGNNGLWHQVLDDERTYEEASCTAMFICAISRGIRENYIKEGMKQAAITAVYTAWDGIKKTVIDNSGNLYGVCQGSGRSFSRGYYRQLNWRLNDIHGIGLAIMAGVEKMKLEEFLR